LSPWRTSASVATVVAMSRTHRIDRHDARSPSGESVAPGEPAAEAEKLRGPGAKAP